MYIGSVDMLMHLLLNITNLPVTKAAIKGSGMGTAIGKIGKHAICKGTPNEHAIEEKLNQLKESWQSSVKANKVVEASKQPAIGDESTTSSPPSEAVKRESPGAATSPSPAKRLKIDDRLKLKVDQKMDVQPKKATLFNSLIKTVKSGASNGVGAGGNRMKSNESVATTTSPLLMPSANRETSSNAIRGNVNQGMCSHFSLSN